MYETDHSTYISRYDSTTIECPCLCPWSETTTRQETPFGHAIMQCQPQQAMSTRARGKKHGLDPLEAKRAAWIRLVSELKYCNTNNTHDMIMIPFIRAHTAAAVLLRTDEDGG